MLLSLGKCPMVCLIGGLVALGCRGETLTLGDSDRATSAAESGRPSWTPTADSLVAGGGAPALAPTAAGTGGAGHTTVTENDDRFAGVAGAGTGGVASDVAPAVAGSAGSRSRRRGGTAAGGGGGSGGELGRGGRGGSSDGGAKAGAGGSSDAAASGCVQNLACQLDAPESSGDAHQDCVDRINQFRQECACLPPLERWRDGEDCADEMAKYDSGGGEAHGAFNAGICEGGSAQNECPGWRSEAQIVGVCLQKMWDEGPPPMSDCNGSCFQMYGHFLNMTNQRLTKVACGFYTREDGQVWSVQNFAR